ncbi:sodium-transporting two-sector ATPase [Candidatus Saccharibacteria bacterium]|nr:sodium-transporting two-sector ATPase [Candidatus Saccharibacteria bacterium]
MFESQIFSKLVKKGQPTAEVVEFNDFIVVTSLLPGVKVHSEVIFAGGAQGVVWQLNADSLQILLLNSELVRAGELVTILNAELSLGVGKKLLGRVVSPLGRPLDGKGFVPSTQVSPYFRAAPPFRDRAMVQEQLESGVTVVDTLLPLVKGQRMAIMGDSKSGKTSFLSQVAIHQAQAGQLVVYVLIAKPRAELNRLVKMFNESGVMKNMVMVVADSMDPLAVGFLAPYAGCAVAESLWYGGQDVIVIYDDFSNHAKIYREMALLVDQNVGREAYPGDMFHVHSALLERAGKLAKTNSAQTVFAVGTTPNNDLTGYQATSLISMSDGQIVFDLETMHQGEHPAINVGLSVSRVGGRSLQPSMQEIVVSVRKEMSRYQTALDYTRFGDQSSQVAQHEIAMGERINEVFRQESGENYSLAQQRLMLEVVLRLESPRNFDVAWLKNEVAKIKIPAKPTDEQYASLASQLLKNGTKIQTEVAK